MFRTTIYLINKLLSAILHGKSPYELLFGEVPQLDHLRVFGCLCYVIRLPRGDNFAERARQAVLIGYSDTQKGYKLCDLVDKVKFISKDVTFREMSFPFKVGQCDVQTDIFLHLSPVVNEVIGGNVAILSSTPVENLADVCSGPASSSEPPILVLSHKEEHQYYQL